MQSIKVTDYILTDILEAERISLEEIHYEDPKEIEPKIKKVPIDLHYGKETDKVEPNGSIVIARLFFDNKVMTTLLVTPWCKLWVMNNQGQTIESKNIVWKTERTTDK